MLSCRKDSLLPEANIGSSSNVFACKVNGKEWVASAYNGNHNTLVGGGTTLADSSHPSRRYIAILGFRPYESIGLYLADFRGKGLYTFNTTLNCGYPACYDLPANVVDATINSTETDYRTSTQYTGICTVTDYDSISFKMRGTFAFKAKDTKTDQVIEVTDGRFYFDTKNY